jgi:hypothetical protein
MSNIFRRRTADGRVRRLLQPTPTVKLILRRRTPDGRVRRIVRSTSRSAVGVSVTTHAAFESLARQSGDNGGLLEWLTLELHSVAIRVEWLGQVNKVVTDEALSIEWAALPASVRVSLERLLASPVKRRILSTPGRLRLLKRL